MLKCATIHPYASSPFQWRPLATLPSLHQPGSQVFVVLHYQPTGTAHSPFELVAWVVL